jgi:hypothetical protein
VSNKESSFKPVSNKEFSRRLIRTDSQKRIIRIKDVYTQFEIGNYKPLRKRSAGRSTYNVTGGHRMRCACALPEIDLTNIV